ncbi:MAG: substrate-binding domain-containing protein [Erysipelotrichaceae bacterium]
MRFQFAKRIFFFASIFALVLSLSACGKQLPDLDDPNITLSTTTSLNDSGLLEYLNPLLLKETGVKMDIVSQGTGAAIQTAMDGNADVIFVHAKASEEKFVTDGYGVKRIEIMYNYFVIVGPKEDPAKIKSGGLTASQALAKIYETGATFVSRGDDSGTHKKELALWKAATVTPSGDAYVSAGKGMGDVLTMTDEMQGYTLTDKATYLSMKDQLDLEILVEESADLLNQYTVIAVNPDKWSTTNTEAVDVFIDWLTSQKTLDRIAEFGKEEYGEALFFINYVE